MALNHPPYHLRTNKAVDRLLLLDQMQRVLANPLAAGRYYSLGGPFMEDLRLVHRRFPAIDLICLESDSHTFKRQQLHRFTKKLSLVRRTLADFLVHDYTPMNGDVFWLDFTDLSLSCLQDFQELLRALLPGSLVRITVRCEPPINERLLTGHLSTEQIKEIREIAYTRLKNELDRLIPPQWTDKFPENYEEFSIFVQQIIRLTASEVLDGSSDRELLHLSSDRYDDGTQMLSLTGLICERSKIRTEVKRLKLNGQNSDPKWTLVPRVINIPHLSVQERIKLDEKLPLGTKASGKGLQTRLGYWIANSKKSSEAALLQYANYYQEYPSFIRMMY